jgi:hypothetical protein
MDFIRFDAMGRGVTRGPRYLKEFDFDFNSELQKIILYNITQLKIKGYLNRSQWLDGMDR